MFLHDDCYVDAYTDDDAFAAAVGVRRWWRYRLYKWLSRYSENFTIFHLMIVNVVIVVLVDDDVVVFVVVVAATDWTDDDDIYTFI